MSQIDLSQLAIDRTESSPTSGSPLRRHLMTRYLFPGLLILGFASLVGWAGRDFVIPPQDVKVIPVLARQSEARAEGASLFNAAGWIEPRPTSIRVPALAAGIVEQLLVVEDQTVVAGEPVAELVKDDANLAYQRAIADRELADAEHRLTQATLVAAKTRFEQPVHLQAKLAEADASLAKISTMLKNLPFEAERAELRMIYSEREYRRNASARDSVSAREVDLAKTAFETAKASLQELRDRESSLKREATAGKNRRDALARQLDLLADEIEARDRAEAQVNAAVARIQQMTVAEREAKLRLDRMTIRAPVNGRIYRLVGVPGTRVGDGVMQATEDRDGATVVTMYQAESLQIRVDVRFEDIPLVQLGQPVRIDNAALPEPIIGHVLFISSEADIQKNTLQVKVAIDSPPDFFKPEMLVDVTFIAPKQQENRSVNTKLRFYVPERFIGQHQGSSFVWTADQSKGVARRVQITTGNSDAEGLIEVTEGVAVGDRIISTGADRLNDGDRVRITGEDDAR